MTAKTQRENMQHTFANLYRYIDLKVYCEYFAVIVF